MTTVRKFSLCGPCINQGELIRETAKFYVFHDRFHTDHIERKARKSNKWSDYHIDPCPSCRDHPQTQYPNGYMD